MARKACTTSGLAHRHAPIASQLSVKYTSENRETEWIAAILLALPQSYLLKWQLRFHSDLQKLQLLAHKAIMNILSQSMDAWLNIARIWFGKLFCLTAPRVLRKKIYVSLLTKTELMKFTGVTAQVEKYSRNINLSYWIIHMC